MRLSFLRTCFGCCQLRTGVIIVAVTDLIFGLYAIVDFSIRVYLESHGPQQITVAHANTTAIPSIFNTTSSTNISRALAKSKGNLYDDSAFAVIVVGCLDIFISAFLVYVAIMRKYDLRIVVFVAAVWGFVMSFLDAISFGISLALEEYIEGIIFGVFCLLELLFAYVILSYFKFMTVVVERGLDDMTMSYFPEETIHTDDDFTEVQMDDAVDERPIMDDQDDFPMHGDDSKIVLT